MPRPPVDYSRKIKETLGHVDPLPEESTLPLEHYKWSSAEHWSLREYVERKVKASKFYLSVANRHTASLDRMLLVSLIETFERFLKETAAVCVDHVAGYVLDRRFDGFDLKGSVLAAHFEAGTLGKALCEAGTWLDCNSINKRFRRLLADPFYEGQGGFILFPNKGQGPAEERFRREILDVIWQLRHTIVHNVGVITKSDAVKFRLLARVSVAEDKILVPTRDDVRHVKEFLDRTAENVNRRVGERLAELLSTLQEEDTSLFEAADKADELAKQFQIPLTVAGKQGTP